MKKLISIVVIAMLALSVLTGCAGTPAPATTEPGTTTPGATAPADAFDSTKEIGVTSRETGSGTRGAFIELFGIEQKDESGEKVDLTTTSSYETNSTSVMMTTIAGDLYGIGYISLGSLNDTVKALEIDGVAASVANIENNTYKIARPFNIVTKEGISQNAQDFIDFILSAEGQAVIEDNGYIAVVKNAPAYAGSQTSGKVVVAGSSSVTPVMEKLKEAYIAINPGVSIEIQQSDSSTGITSTIDGICDIGMASRELKDTEIAKGVGAKVIAMDGIAVIVNNGNPLTGLTSEQVMKIFTGEITTWGELVK